MENRRKSGRSIGINVKRMCAAPAFFIAAAAVFFILLSGYVYIDSSNGKAYSIFTLLFTQERRLFIEKAGLVSHDIALSESRGSLWMFAPIVAGLPFVAVLCSGNAHHSTRFEIYRTGKNRYLLGRLCSAMLAGGLLMTLGQILYIIVVYAVMGLPSLDSSYMAATYQNGAWSGSVCKTFGLAGMLFLKLLSSFLYGWISSYFVVLFSVFIRNKYLIISIPFMMNYILNGLLQSWISKGMDPLFRSKVFQAVVFPQNMQSVFLMEGKEAAAVLLVNLCLAAGLFLVHRIALERRCDCGE